MKIAVTSRGPDLDSQVEPRFGRCPYFLIIETETLEFEALENPNVALGGGAGIQSAQLLANSGVQTVLTGNCGPNAFQTLGAAQIQIIVGVSGTVRQAVEQLKQGAFSGAAAPNVASHFGMSAADQSGTANTSAAPPMPMGRGGGGMGMGGGQGMGRGMGMGGGRGMGRGMGMGGGATATPPSGPSIPSGPMPPQTSGSLGREQELQMLKAQAQDMGAQLQSINARINDIEHSGAPSTLIAVVEAEKCTGCGVCQQVCPTDAISVDDIAGINRKKCTGCGQCVAECPQDALSLKKA